MDVADAGRDSHSSVGREIWIVVRFVIIAMTTMTIISNMAFATTARDFIIIIGSTICIIDVSVVCRMFRPL